MLPRHRTRVVLSFVILTAWLLIFAPPASANGGGGQCRTTTTSVDDGVSVQVDGFCYLPTVLHVEVGETVMWTNLDRAPHTVTGINGTWGSSDQFGQDESVGFTFDEPGVYGYYCVLHGGMVGVVVVGDAPTPVAATASDSTVALPPSAEAPGTTQRSDSGSSHWVWLGMGGVLGVVVTGAGTAVRRRARLR